MEEMETFVVGKKAPDRLWKNREPTSGCFVVEYGGWMIVLCIHKPTDKERELFCTEKIKVKILTTPEEDFLLTLLEFDEDLAFELPFDPTEYTKEFQEKLLEKNLVAIVIIDSSDGRIVEFRVATFPKEYEMIAKQFWRKIINEYGIRNYIINSEYYNALINRYSLGELLNFGKYVGYFGDTMEKTRK